MLDTLLQIIPFSLAGAINPLGILIIFTLLAKEDKPVKRAWIFLVGSTVVLIALIFITKFLLGSTVHDARQENSTSAIIDIVFGVFLICWGIFKKKKQKTDVQKSSKMWQVFIGGILFMAILDIETIVFYLASMKVIYEANLQFFQKFIIYAINIIIVMSTMAFPVLLATLFPKSSAKILNSLRQFFVKYGDIITKVVIFAIAIYLIYLGLSFFY